MRSLRPDSTISHYRIIELIGRGGMGEIYKAVDLQLGRVLALKTLSPELTADQKAHQRLLREARAASILSHPNICTVFEVGKERGLVFIAMQYVEGKTIQELLLQGTLPIETAVGYALDVVEALEEAHKKGVIHRDIKPSNIIVNDRGTAVVLDFGLAKQIVYLDALIDESPTMLQVTTSATIIGTAPYMSPEQIRNEDLDGRSDIFSFGSTLYEMLTGERPFTGQSRIDVMHSILHVEQEPVCTIRPEVERELDSIVSKALNKDPRNRYQSASELKLALVEYAQRSELLFKRVSTEPAKERSPVTAETRVLPTGSFISTTVRILSPLISVRGALILLVAAATIGAIWWSLVRTHDEPQRAFRPSLRFVQLVNWKNEPGADAGDAVFSPDGRMIAYTLKREGYRNIWIKQTTGGDASQVTRDEWDNKNPVWSPDGTQLAFCSRRGDYSGIWRVPILGGTPTLVGKLEDAGAQLKHWSKDGSTLYYESNSNLFVMNLASGQTTLLTDFDPTKVFNESFSISPNEDRIVYVAVNDGQHDLWTSPIAGGPATQITKDLAEDRGPSWHPDGKRIIYSSKRDGTFQVFAAFVDGRAPRQVTFGESDSFVVDVSADGEKILCTASKDESDIWGVKIATGEEFEVTSDIGVELWPDISPDSKTITFQAIRDPSQGAKLLNCNILTKSLASRGQLIQLAANGFNATWSPNGKIVAFMRMSGNICNIWTVDATGGDEKQLTKTGVYEMGSNSLPYNRRARDYHWSPDGSRIAYCSEDPTESVLWIVPVNGSDPIKIRSEPNLYFYSPLWSSNGEQIATLSEPEKKPPDGKKIRDVWRTDLRTGRSENILQEDADLQLIGWFGSDGDLIVATMRDLRQGLLGEVDLIHTSSTGGAQTIARLKSAYLRNIQLSPDKQTVAFASHQDDRDNIWLIPTKGGQPRRITANTDRWLYFSSLAFSPDGKAVYFGKQSRWSLISMIENFN